MEPKGIEIRQQTADENGGNCSANFYFHVYNDNIKKDTLYWLFTFGSEIIVEQKKDITWLPRKLLHIPEANNE